jgi:2-oxoglutarate ferredoxin oxidoreductase subunit alpha
MANSNEIFEINILIGGEAGQGLVTIGQMLSRALVKAGYEICITQSYMSRIRGGANTFAIRTSTKKILSTRIHYDILVALNDETVALHLSSLKENGLLIADKAVQSDYPNYLKVPFDELGAKKVENTVALGILGAILKLDIRFFEELITATFGKKHADLLDDNFSALKKSFEFLQANKPDFPDFAKADCCRERMMLNGNEAIALGAIAAGVKFCSFYPMTPSTSIALTIAHHAKDMGIVVEQAEDEIAAINMALGASYAGATPIVTTSGGGFALMCEGISLAGMLELPVVVALAQRPGPATGLPTRTEQGDLNLAMYAGHGEFPRAIFAPSTVESSFEITQNAFHIANEFQSPVFIITDQFLADQYQGLEPLNPNNANPVVTTGDKPASLPYKRYEITENGVSPRLIPGLTENLVISGSDEHTENGKLTEDLDMRIKMVNKRIVKLCGIFDRVIPPKYIGVPYPDLLLVCWGSSFGAVKESMDILNEEGNKVSMLCFEQVCPLNAGQFIHYLKSAASTVCIEGNATAQFASLLRMETGFVFDELILCYDGLPFTPGYILEALKK